jgi:lipoprotein-anchoring transpeptidase ErfK/SrfK
MTLSGKIHELQAAIGEDRLRLIQEHWLPVVAFVALTLPLALVGPSSAPLAVNPASIPIQIQVPTIAHPAPQPAPVTTPAPLPQAAAKRSPAQPKSSHRILISIPDRKLAVLENGKVRKIYPVAVGAEVSPSPTGQFHIAHKIVAPNYSHNGKVIAAGKGNPLGSRWMGLDIEHYGIHGTNMPKSIGHAASHGCIRMGKHDVEELFEMASVGDVVEIHEERTEEMAQVFGSLQEATQPEQPVEVAHAEQLGAGGSR